MNNVRILFLLPFDLLPQELTQQLLIPCDVTSLVLVFDKNNDLHDSMSTITTPATKLRGSKDWSQWYTRLRHLCVAHDCWAFVNPDTEDVPTKPQRPTMDEAADEAARNRYMVERDNYNEDKEEYKDVKGKLASIAMWIFYVRGRQQYEGGFGGRSEPPCDGSRPERSLFHLA